eukprot:1160019-Pelagomonas_calceolata.AAC.1
MTGHDRAYDVKALGRWRVQRGLQLRCADAQNVRCTYTDTLTRTHAFPRACEQAWLGAHTRGFGGVVLHSPLLSGVRVLSPNIKWCALYFAPVCARACRAFCLTCVRVPSTNSHIQGCLQQTALTLTPHALFSSDVIRSAHEWLVLNLPPFS